MAKKSKPKIELPQIKHSKSGLRKRGKTWFALYYEDGKLISRSTGATNLKSARENRDWLHRTLLKQGATYKGTGNKPALQEAITNPDGDACIYEKTTYVVIVDGTTVVTTTDKDKAKSERNAFIDQHYRS